MNAAIIGIALGIVSILIIIALKLNKPVMYALVLAGIGFLYVGYTWTDIPTLATTILQALAFTFLAYFGVKKNFYFLIAGYFLHGLWDIFYGFVFSSALIPPHYDWFCLSIDFTMGLYLFIIRKSVKISNT